MAKPQITYVAGLNSVAAAKHLNLQTLLHKFIGIYHNPNYVHAKAEQIHSHLQETSWFGASVTTSRTP